MEERKKAISWNISSSSLSSGIPSPDRRGTFSSSKLEKLPSTPSLRGKHPLRPRKLFSVPEESSLKRPRESPAEHEPIKRHRPEMDPTPSTSGITTNIRRLRSQIGKYVRVSEEGKEEFEDYCTTPEISNRASNDENVEAEEAVRESRGGALDILGRTYDDEGEPSVFLPGTRGKKREWSSSTYSGSVKNLKRVTPKLISVTSSPDRRGRSRASKQEKPPSTPFPRGRSRASKQEKPLSTPFPRGRSKLPVPEKSLSVPKESSLKRKRPIDSAEHFRPEESPPESEPSPSKKGRPGMSTEFLNSEEEREPSWVKRGKTFVKRGQKKSASKVCPGSSNGNISGSTNALRRSTRFRVPPLETWRNQRLVFKTLASGEVQCMGIDKGAEADNTGLRQMERKAARIKLQKKRSEQRRKLSRSTTTNLRNIETGRLVPTTVHQSFESLRWTLPPTEDRPAPYRLTKAFTSHSISFGFLELSPFGTKDEQYSPTDNIHFNIIKGHLEVTIQDRKFLFKVGDSFIVPSGVPYSITNCSTLKALVSFCHFRGPCFPHQYHM